MRDEPTIEILLKGSTVHVGAVVYGRVRVTLPETIGLVGVRARLTGFETATVPVRDELRTSSNRQVDILTTLWGSSVGGDEQRLTAGEWVFNVQFTLPKTCAPTFEWVSPDDGTRFAVQYSITAYIDGGDGDGLQCVAPLRVVHWSAPDPRRQVGMQEATADNASAELEVADPYIVAGRPVEASVTVENMSGAAVEALLVRLCHTVRAKPGTGPTYTRRDTVLETQWTRGGFPVAPGQKVERVALSFVVPADVSATLRQGGRLSNKLFSVEYSVEVALQHAGNVTGATAVVPVTLSAPRDNEAAAKRSARGTIGRAGTLSGSGSGDRSGSGAGEGGKLGLPAGVVPSNYRGVMVRALYDYTPESDRGKYELTLKKHDMLMVLDWREGSGWLKAELGNRIGVAPVTYVQPPNTVAQPTPGADDIASRVSARVVARGTLSRGQSREQRRQTNTPFYAAGQDPRRPTAAGAAGAGAATGAGGGKARVSFGASSPPASPQKSSSSSAKGDDGRLRVSTKGKADQNSKLAKMFGRRPESVMLTRDEVEKQSTRRDVPAERSKGSSSSSSSTGGAAATAAPVSAAPTPTPVAAETASPQRNRSQTSKLAAMLGVDKDEARRRRESGSRLQKEKQGGDGSSGGDDESDQVVLSQSSGSNASNGGGGGGVGEGGVDEEGHDALTRSRGKTQKVSKFFGVDDDDARRQKQVQAGGGRGRGQSGGQGRGRGRGRGRGGAGQRKDSGPISPISPRGVRKLQEEQARASRGSSGGGGGGGGGGWVAVRRPGGGGSADTAATSTSSGAKAEEAATPTPTAAAAAAPAAAEDEEDEEEFILDPEMDEPDFEPPKPPAETVEASAETATSTPVGDEEDGRERAGTDYSTLAEAVSTTAISGEVSDAGPLAGDGTGSDADADGADGAETFVVDDPDAGRQFRMGDNFTAQDDDEVTVKQGDVVTLLYKEASGWWMVETVDGRSGIVPGTFCDPA